MNRRREISRRLLCVLLLAAGSLSACTSYVVNMQDPSTLPEGETRFGVGGTAFLPWNLAVWGHFGLTDRLELQVRAGFPASAELGLKLGVVGDSVTTGPLMAVSLSGGAHHVFTSNAFGGDETVDVSYGESYSYRRRPSTASLIPIDASLQLGYRFKRDFVLYVAPRYSYRAIASDDIVEHGWGVFLGASGGRRQSRVFFEIGLNDNPFRWESDRDFLERYFLTLSFGAEWD